VVSFPLTTYTHSSSPPFMPHARQSHPQLHYSNYTWRRVQIVKLLVMQFCTLSCHLIPPWSKYLQHPVLKCPKSMFLP
jgi:hypothetical protein